MSNFYLCHPSTCAYFRSIVWHALKAVWLSRELTADFEYKTSAFRVTGCALRCLTFELRTQRPVWAAVNQDAGAWERRRRERKLRRRLTAKACAVQYIAQWELYWKHAVTHTFTLQPLLNMSTVYDSLLFNLFIACRCVFLILQWCLFFPLFWKLSLYIQDLHIEIPPQFSLRFSAFEWILLQLKPASGAIHIITCLPEQFPFSMIYHESSIK